MPGFVGKTDDFCFNAGAVPGADTGDGSAALFPLEETNAVSGTVWTRSKFAVARLSDILHENYR